MTSLTWVSPWRETRRLDAPSLIIVPWKLEFSTKKTREPKTGQEQGQKQVSSPRSEKVMTRVGFEPTPFRTTESLWRFGLRVNLNVAP